MSIILGFTFFHLVSFHFSSFIFPSFLSFYYSILFLFSCGLILQQKEKDEMLIILLQEFGITLKNFYSWVVNVEEAPALPEMKNK